MLLVDHEAGRHLNLHHLDLVGATPTLRALTGVLVLAVAADHPAVDVGVDGATVVTVGEGDLELCFKVLPRFARMRPPFSSCCCCCRPPPKNAANGSICPPAFC